MFPASDLDIFPGKVSAGMFEPMDDYIDFNSDAWGEGCKSINDMNSIGGKHYLSCVYANTGFVMIYNKKTIEENGLDDPAELAYNNEWTWSKFEDMCYEFADREQDKYAVGGWWYEPAMILSTGNPNTTRGAYGKRAILRCFEILTVYKNRNRLSISLFLFLCV